MFSTDGNEWNSGFELPHGNGSCDALCYNISSSRLQKIARRFSKCFHTVTFNAETPGKHSDYIDHLRPDCIFLWSYMLWCYRYGSGSNSPLLFRWEEEKKHVLQLSLSVKFSQYREWVVDLLADLCLQILRTCQ